MKHINKSENLKSKTTGIKKKLICLPIKDRIKMIDRNSKNIGITRQSELVGISRQVLYYKPIINLRDKQVMDAIDKIYTDHPYYGRIKMKLALHNEYGITVGFKKIRTLKSIMGLETIYPKPKKGLSDPNKKDHKYPYLLKNIDITKPNQVWATDITYIPTTNGWIYLVAMMDWFSRYVLSWELSNTLETDFCTNVLIKALKINKPDIHNSDQGSQFTSNDYTGILKENEIQISMDSRGRYLDNIFVERLWRSVKYDAVYINSYNSIRDAYVSLDEYFNKYNTKRYHQSLNYKTPEQVFLTGKI